MTNLLRISDVKVTGRQISSVLLACLFIAVGILHFLKPILFVRIMPVCLDHKVALVYISGVCEILGGLGILRPKTRKWAGLGLIALLIAVFPANINMALNSQEFANIPAVVLWLRLPLQFVLIGWVWWTAIKVKLDCYEPL